MNKIREQWKKYILEDRKMIKEKTGKTIRGFGYDNKENKKD
jgi:protein-disulfide isomerase-like protein with CxxC motif